MTLDSLCGTYYEARKAWEKAKAQAAFLAGLMEAAKQRLIDEMLAQNMRAYPRNDGSLISLKNSFSCSVTEKNMDYIREWLVETKGDDRPFLKEVVDKEELTKELQKMLENHSIDDFPEFLNVSTRPNVAVYGWTNKETEEDQW